jgi:hypothetical protein
MFDRALKGLDEVCPPADANIVPQDHQERLSYSSRKSAMALPWLRTQQRALKSGRCPAERKEQSFVALSNLGKFALALPRTGRAGAPDG